MAACSLVFINTFISTFNCVCFTIILSIMKHPVCIIQIKKKFELIYFIFQMHIFLCSNKKLCTLFCQYASLILCRYNPEFEYIEVEKIFPSYIQNPVYHSTFSLFPGNCFGLLTNLLIYFT